MTVISPARMIVEDRPADGPCGPNRALWISEAGGLTQFGAFIEVLPPGSRSSIRHWHSAEDEMVFVLEGEITLHEGSIETVLRPDDAATFRAGDPSAIFSRTGAPSRRAAWSSAPVRRSTPSPMPTMTESVVATGRSLRISGRTAQAGWRGGPTVNSRLARLAAGGAGATPRLAAARLDR
jgi:Cupin domain